MVSVPSGFLAIITALAVAAVVQFSSGRRVNLSLIEFTARTLEDCLRPVNKEYTWIGVYVGYQARFKLREKGVSRVEATVTLVPRQSLLYYPISKLTSRFDKAYLVFHLDKPVAREAHVVRKRYYVRGVSRVIKGYERMRKEDVQVKDTVFHLVYTSREAVEKLLELPRSLGKPSLINHLALVPATNTLYLAVKIEPESFEEVVKKALELARSIASKNTSSMM